MYNGYDFIYDGKSSISENVKMLYTEGSPFEFTKSIPDKEYSMYKANQSSKWHLAGITTPEPLTFQMQIMLYSDDIDLYAKGNPLIKRNQLSRIAHWLFDVTTFRKLQILTDDMRDFYFMAVFKDVEYFEAGGDVCGFRATVMCDTTGAYEEKVVKKTCSGETEFTIRCLHDGIYEIQPLYEITPKGTEVSVTVNGETMVLKSITPGSTITIDTETLITKSSVQDNLYVQDRFNKVFPTMVNGKNIITVSGNCEININYKTIREVGC